MMHQTSSKLLRMTDDERPFTRVSPHSISIHWFIQCHISIYVVDTTICT
jgi:hypothetical protein